MLITPTKAVKLFKVSKPTLYNDMKSGKLSFELDGRRKRKINVAELERLYDGRKDIEEGLTSSSVKPKRNFTTSNENNLNIERQIETLHEQIQTNHKREVELLNNQIEQLQNQVDSLNKNLNKALDVTALLEDKREGQGFKQAEIDIKLKSMEALVEELHTQNKRLLEKEEERQKRAEERRKQREYEVIAERDRNKSVFKRFFG